MDIKMGERPNFSGTWKQVKMENFEDFMAANGANWFIRKAASMSSPQVIIEQDGDNFVIKMVTIVKTVEETFTVGTPSKLEAMGGIKMKVTSSWEGDVLLMELEPEEQGKGKPYTKRRELRDGQLIMTLHIDDVVCKQYFDKAKIYI